MYSAVRRGSTISRSLSATVGMSERNCVVLMEERPSDHAGKTFSRSDVQEAPGRVW